jgi:hypothetical protein
MKIIKMKSALPLTEYAPTWDISFGANQYDDTTSIDNIKKWLIDNEQMIVDKFPLNNDGGTGLGDKSVTSRYGQYNLFNFIDQCPELEKLLEFFRITYLKFVSKDGTPIKPCDIVCWYNILRPGEEIKGHFHGAGHDAYLSGNMHLDNYDTVTSYRNPFDHNVWFPAKNLKGVCTIFPSYVWHKTDEYKASDLRVSVAFDLHARQGALWKSLKADALQATPFIDDHIINQINLTYPNLAKESNNDTYYC